jgi:hypothetical protein
MPSKPNDTVAPAALAMTDPCACVADKSATVTPSPCLAAPMQSPPRFNNQKIEFSTIKMMTKTFISIRKEKHEWTAKS